MFDKNWLILGSISSAIAATLYVIWGPSQNSKRRKGLCPGLENIGNTCFLNAVLQSWAACQSMVQWLSDFLEIQNEASRSKFIADPLLKTLNVLNNKDGMQVEVHSPAEILGALRLRRWIITHDEQDAHELFHILTSTLDEESVKYPGVLPLFDLQSLQNPINRYQQDRDAVTKSHGLLPLLPRKEKEHPFRGLLASQLKCRDCGYRHPVRYDLFNSLSLSFPKTTLGSIRLEALLQRFITTEVVYGIECPGCFKKTYREESVPGVDPIKSDAVKTLTIGKLPQCLCIHLQRTQWLSNGLPIKKFEKVPFPEVLTMDEYLYTNGSKKAGAMRNGLIGGRSLFRTCVPTLPSPTSGPVNLLRVLNYDSRSTAQSLFLQSPSQSPLSSQSDINHNTANLPKLNSEYTYRLMAVVVHLGDVFSGHFVTYRRSPWVKAGESYSSRWLCTSDAAVQEASLEEVLGCEAYMLFYERFSASSGV